MQLYNHIEADQEYIIFASDFGSSVTERHLKDNAIPYKPLLGRYKDTTGKVIDEVSYLVNVKHMISINSLIQDQESVLLLGIQTEKGRQATLVFNTDKKDIGYFHSEIDTVAKEQDNYTYDPISREYYVCS